MRIRRGACYLLEDETADTAYRLFVRLLAEMGSGFCISRIHPDKVRTRFGLGEVRIGWLAEVPGEDHFSANAMAFVAKAIQQFIQEHGSSGIVLIDGLEYVILHNGFQPTLLAFVEHLNEFTMGTQAIVLIAFRPQTLDPRELALLERNLQVLEGADVKSQLDVEELGEILGVDAPAEGTSTEKIEATKVLSPLPDMGGLQVERVRCPKCGTENDTEVAFCVYCGSLLPDRAGTPTAPTAPPAPRTSPALKPNPPVARAFPDRRHRLHPEHEPAERSPVLVGSDRRKRPFRPPSGRNHRERDHLLRTPRPIELPHLGPPMDPRSKSFRRARSSPRGRRIPLPGVPHVAILAARDVRFARHLRLDGNPRDVPSHLHRGGPVLGPGSTTGPDRRSSADLETLSPPRRAESAPPSSRATQGRTSWDVGTPPGGMYRLPQSHDQMLASFPPPTSMRVTV